MAAAFTARISTWLARPQSTATACGTARTDISGTVTIAAGSRLTLDGGNLNDENWLLDGTINGPGALGAGNFHALHGFGTIHADIDFDGDSELFAQSGTLILTGDILDARLLGTFDGEAILDVTNPWNTGRGHASCLARRRAPRSHHHER